MKTVRFSQVVARAGQPEVHVSWLPPQKDPILKKALAEYRVMTVHQQLRGARKDFGSVGLHRDGPGQILVFPKSLRRFAERKVVGVDYELLPKASNKPELSSAAHLEPASRLANRDRSHERQRVDQTPGLRSLALAAPRKSGRATRASRPQHKKPQPRESPPQPASRTQLVAAIRRAVADLKAGRAVPAYERLKRLLDDESR